VTSSSIMSAAGLSASTASSVVHLAQLGTTLVSGISHYRAHNVEPTTTARMSAWGFGGAFGGACILARLPASGAKVVAAALLVSVGGYLLARSYRLGTGNFAGRTPPRLSFIVPLALVAGFVDATGGGGWGPVATSGLLANAALAPAAVIGTVSLSEFFATVGCVLGFYVASLVGLSAHADDADASLRLDLVFALLAGGLAAAPVAPALIKHLDPRALGTAVGGFICLTNSRPLLKAAGVHPLVKLAVYAMIVHLTWKTVVRTMRSTIGDVTHTKAE